MSITASWGEPTFWVPHTLRWEEITGKLLIFAFFISLWRWVQMSIRCGRNDIRCVLRVIKDCGFSCRRFMVLVKVKAIHRCSRYGRWGWLVFWGMRDAGGGFERSLLQVMIGSMSCQSPGLTEAFSTIWAFKRLLLWMCEPGRKNENDLFYN